MSSKGFSVQVPSGQLARALIDAVHEAGFNITYVYAPEGMTAQLVRADTDEVWQYTGTTVINEAGTE